MSREPMFTEADNWQLKWEPNDTWKALQLTDEQKAALRARTEQKVARARAEGVYERFAGLRGSIEFALPYWQLRGID